MKRRTSPASGPSPPSSATAGVSRTTRSRAARRVITFFCVLMRPMVRTRGAPAGTPRAARSAGGAAASSSSGSALRTTKRGGGWARRAPQKSAATSELATMARACGAIRTSTLNFGGAMSSKTRQRSERIHGVRVASAAAPPSTSAVVSHVCTKAGRSRRAKRTSSAATRGS
jgi:hypothetical protein